MLKQLVRSAGAAALLLCAAAAPALAQTNARLGWMTELAGSCWQGRDGAGAVVDRQCFQNQFDFVRASITRGEFSGDSVFGYSRDRMRLEMYAWGNQGEPTIYTPTYRDGVYAFEGVAENGAPTRVVWRRSEDGFQVAEQTQQNAAWSDTNVVTYSRDGAAPASFSAGASMPVLGAGFGWLDRIAGRCYRQIEPTRDPNSRGCFAYQHPHVLRQTWYGGPAGAATGESVMFLAPGGDGLRFFYWDARGGFGVGSSTWAGQQLVSITDAADDYRRVLRRRGSGFMIVTERRTNDPSLPWEYNHHYRFTAQ
jgi:hypothetical protein